MKYWLPKNVIRKMKEIEKAKEFNEKSKLREKLKAEKVEKMSNRNFEYDYDGVGFNPNLFKRKKYQPKREFKCTCSKCFKEFFGYKRQAYAKTRLCPECTKASKIKHNFCSVCGRKSHSFIYKNPETKNKPNLCSFCLKNRTRIIEVSVPLRFCSYCGCRIKETTFQKYNGLCKNCFDIKKILVESKKVN